MHALITVGDAHGYLHRQADVYCPPGKDLSHTDHTDGTDRSLTRLCCLRVKRTRIFRMTRIALWAWLLEEVNINRINTRRANSHDSSFDGKI